MSLLSVLNYLGIPGSDLFEIKCVNYLLIVDYFSMYPEVCKMSSTTSLQAIKKVFSCYGILATICRDNGPQYSS